MVNAIQFPDDSAFPRSEKGDEIIFGGSVGINRILALFKERADTDRTAHWSLFALNAFTIAKNVFVPNMHITHLRDAFFADCELFCTYLEAYLSRFPWSPNLKVPVVIYFPTYKKIPENIRREIKGNELAVLDLYEQFRKTAPQTPVVLSESLLTERWAVPVGDHALPHTELLAWIKQYSMSKNSNAFVWGSKVFLMTSCPVDLHIGRFLPEVELVERYTAAIKLPREFGTKLIKDVPIPFNFATHRAFGDSTQIAPIAQRKVRAELIEVAKERKWMTRTPETIVNDIVRVTGVTMSELTRFRFQ